MLKKAIIFLSFTFLFTETFPFQKTAEIQRVEPMFWWVDFKNPKLQLLVYGKDISAKSVSLKYAGVTLERSRKVENPNYVFLDLLIKKGTKPGIVEISFAQKGKKTIIYDYELKARNTGKIAQGVNTSDLIYLIMPDRFANGDYSNDKVAGMKDPTFNRDSIFYRHGGDLQGIINKLNYFKDLGVTTLWLNPVLENDELKTSYHGYANTENYRIDRRFGTNQLYKNLIDKAHEKGLKVIKDLVHNHVGSQHYTILDKPMKDWVHNWPAFTRTTYKDQTVFDPYASESDKKIMQNGWFDTHMPDLNQDNEFVQNYTTQSHIFWIEYACLDGFRLDTYAYNDPLYMAKWGKDIKNEYPSFTFFGETWVNGLANQAFFTQGKTINQKLDTELQGTTDFQVYFAILASLNEKFGWTEGVNKLYTVLASDFIYQNPNRNVLHLDNHDLGRIFSMVGEDMAKYKSAIAMLMTIRGIPQLYYGTEILMKGYTNPDGLVRLDFPGGWKEDKKNKFTEAGRTDKENEAFNYIKKLANYRKNTDALYNGKTMQFVPEDGIYVYFRYNDTKTIMVVFNSNDVEKKLDLTRFKERTNKFNTAIEITGAGNLPNLSTLKISAKTTFVYELGR